MRRVHLPRRVLILRLCRKQHWECIYCRTLMSKNYCPTNGRSATVEHMVPVSKGGTRKMDNLAAACLRCNNSKGEMTVEEFVHSGARPIAIALKEPS